MLSSHRDIVSAGELGDFSLLVKRMARTPSPMVLDGGAGENAARVIDKMPLNVLNADLIHRLAERPNPVPAPTSRGQRPFKLSSAFCDRLSVL